MIPKLVEEAKADDECETLGYDLWFDYTNHPPAYITVMRWVHIIGYKHSNKKKSYMVDSHEHEYQRHHRDKFTLNYLTVLDPRYYCWVQIPQSEFEMLPKRSEILHSGYTYIGVNGVAMMEFHIDDHSCLQDYANENTKSLEVTSVLAVLENQLSYLDKMNPFTINFSLEVSSGLANQENEHSYQGRMEREL